MDERRSQQRQAARERQNRRRDHFTVDERETQRNRNRDRMRRTRSQMSEEERNVYNNRSRELIQRRRTQMNEEEREMYNTQARERLRTRRSAMDEEERQEQRSINRQQMRVRRNDMTEEERLMDLENRRNRNNIDRNYAHNIQFINPDRFYIGSMNVICEYCQALRFQGESLNCCHNGKVSLEPLREYPVILRELFQGNDRDSTNFRKNIRNYNSSFAFASFGAAVKPPPGHGPYCFRLQGQIYHYATNLHPNENEERKYGQLYIIETNEALNVRLNANQNSNCLYSVFEKISQAMVDNPYVGAYKSMRTVELEEQQRATLQNVTPRKITMQFIAGPDARRYNNPTNDEIAVIFVGDNGAPPVHRDIIVYPEGQQRERISYLSCHLDPMIYPLLFPHGESGWHINIPHVENRQTRVRNKVSMQEFYAYRLSIRGGFSPIHSGGKLFQQYIVDAYVKVEGCRLKFIAENQAQLRVAMYSGLMDHLARNNETEDPGIPVILPSSFTGSPRNMQQCYQDAMAIVCKYGRPDLFITYTCNPKCLEVIENLQPHENAQNRPDLLARVFKQHLNELMIDIKDRHVLGVPIAAIHVIEFQKRGLPHCHMLIMLCAEDKLRSKEQIDNIVSAELPSEHDPELRQLVKKLMIHGPCGTFNPNSICMVEGECQKKFPMSYQEETITNVSGYPLYRRRNNGDSVRVGDHDVDCRFVVPYNKYLLRKYGAHINVEVCTSVKSVKYLFKYVYKGHDCAMMEMNINHNETNEHEYNEIKKYITCRYVSPPEAFWRLSEYKMYGQSHTVYRLALHLPDEQQVYYRPGEQRQAAVRAEGRDTQLTAWFKLNQSDVDARGHLYIDIPEYYVFNKQSNTWTRRQRHRQIVTRMYSASPRNAEKFHLRMLLLHVPGATSFADLKTVGGEELPTFKDACIRLQLLEDDNELQMALSEAAIYQMPRQLLNMFAMICLFNTPQNALQLWNDNKHLMIEDLLRQYDNNIAENIALHRINIVLNENGTNCAMLGLPQPINNPPVIQYVEEIQEVNPEVLNIEQRNVFDSVINAVNAIDRGLETKHRLFYLDAPGGSGKTFLFNMIHDYLMAQNVAVSTSAWTGIAATLLKNGKTLHSIFKFPVPLTETIVCNISHNSDQANILRQVKVFIIDEVSMIPRYALNAIDNCLQDIMNNNSIFGGKVIILGGDFRQILPVVPRAPPAAVLDVCLKKSPIWHHFHQLRLSQNMRTNENEQVFSQWLLQIGNGRVHSSLDNVSHDTIDIPEQCVCDDSLVSDIFDNCTQDEMKNRVILSPKNADCLEVNEYILRRLPTESKTYLSIDSVSADNEMEANNYPMEFINSLTPSGMPPHRLNLKVGAIIMLLRNLSIMQGLCNGTRLEVLELHNHSILASIISGSHAQARVLIPRIRLTPSDANIPFVLHRTQFPVRLSYSMTINKAQGQTFDKVGIYLPQPCFTHGQLYVAFSRARSMNSVKVKICPQNKSTHGQRRGTTFTRNIVYKEVL